MTNTDTLETMRRLADWLDSDHLYAIWCGCTETSIDRHVLFAALLRAELAGKGWKILPTSDDDLRIYKDEGRPLPDGFGPCWTFQEGFRSLDTEFNPDSALSEAQAVITAAAEIMGAES